MFGLLAFHERFRNFVADCAVWSYLVIVSAPSFQFLAGIFEAHVVAIVASLVRATMATRVQAFCAEFPVERLDIAGPSHDRDD